MTDTKRNIESQQAQELANKLWAIANDLRGQMDANKFRNYILGVIFYRYLSEMTEDYMQEILKDDGLTYEESLENPEFSDTVRAWSIEHLGYVIEPKNLWRNLIAKIDAKTFSIEDFEKAVQALIESTVGQDSEAAFDKLFDDMNLEDKDLGKEVSDRTALISKVMLKINDISFGAKDAEFDVLGTAYMILIGLFQSEAGKKGGEYFTPTCVSELVARLATYNMKEIRTACDPCAGSGSLLLLVQRYLSDHHVGHFYADEKNGTTYNLLRMNLLMHGVPYRQFTTFNEDMLITDKFYENGRPVFFDVQVSNPPYSADNTAFSKIDDPRYKAAGVAAPKSHADLAFLESMVFHMKEGGRIAVVLPHGVLFRGNAEDKIRRYLIDNLNVIDAVIGLPANLFHGTSIPVCIVVCRKGRNGDSRNIMFIDASKEFIKGKNKNIISEEAIDKIMSVYANRKDVERYAHVASMDEIKKNDYNLNIPRYVDTSEPEKELNLDEMISNITKDNQDIKECEASLKKYFDELGIKFPEE